MLRLGIIGTNFISDWMMTAKQYVPELVPTAVYSRREETGRIFADKYGIVSVYTDLTAFAESDEFDAVYVASPICCHYTQSLLMLEHGKHVLCEKPATSSARETTLLIEAAKSRGLVFLEAMRLAYDDALPIIAETLPRIGQLRRATFDFSQYSSRYDRIRAGEQGINAFDPSLSNAAVMDLGCYCVHALVALFGKPERVASHSFFLENGFEGGGVVLLGYPGFTGEATYSKVAQQTLPSCLLGEDGMILLDNMNHTCRIWLEPRKGQPEELPYREKPGTNMMFELQAFCDFVSKGEQPEKRNQDTLWTMEVLDEVRRQNGIVFPADK